MADKITIRFSLGIGINNAEHVGEFCYDRAEWEAFTDDEKAAEAEEWANEYIDIGWKEVD